MLPACVYILDSVWAVITHTVSKDFYSFKILMYELNDFILQLSYVY